MRYSYSLKLVLILLKISEDSTFSCPDFSLVYSILKAVLMNFTVTTKEDLKYLVLI